MPPVVFVRNLLLFPTDTYLVNSTGTPTAGGSAAAAATTPFSINLSSWTLTATKREVIYMGGPPYQIGSKPLSVGFGVVTETVEIGIAGATYDLIELLRKRLNTALWRRPAYLHFQPSAGANTTIFEIYSADVQEVGDWQNPTAGFTEVLCRVTWTRSAFGVRSSQLLIANGTSLQNQFTGIPTNSTPLAAADIGNLSYDGQPLNLTLTTALMTSSIYLATTMGVSSGASTQTVTTSLTAGAFAAAGDTRTLPPQTEDFITSRLRLFVQTSATSVNGQFRMHVYYSQAIAPSASPKAGLIMVTPWFSPASNSTLYDCGMIPIEWARYTAQDRVYILMEVRSRAGAPVTFTLANIFLVNYIDMCRLDIVDVINYTVTSTLEFRGFETEASAPPFPLPKPVAWATSGGVQRNPIVIAGSAPKYRGGTSLMMISDVCHAGYEQAVYSSARTWTLTANVSPLYYTLRGS